MVLSDSRRTPQLVESSHRHGTSGIWLHTKPDHLCTTMITQSRMDRIITLNCSSECPHLTSVPLLPSRLSYLLSWGRMQYTRLLDSWLNSGMTWATPEWNHSRTSKHTHDVIADAIAPILSIPTQCLYRPITTHIDPEHGCPVSKTLSAQHRRMTKSHLTRARLQSHSAQLS